MMTAATNVTALPDRKAARNAEKKRELALHALSSLAELGYARTNLRDVAQRSGASLGVIHYYFANKTELLTYSMGLYKEDFVHQIENLIAAAPAPEVLALALADFMAQTVDEHAQVHRLWYDVRAQAQYEAAFQPCVQEVEQALLGIFHALFARLTVMGVPLKENDPLRLYIIIDGWFRHFLQRQLAGDANAAAAFRLLMFDEFRRLI